MHKALIAVFLGLPGILIWIGGLFCTVTLGAILAAFAPHLPPPFGENLPQETLLGLGTFWIGFLMTCGAEIMIKGRKLGIAVRRIPGMIAICLGAQTLLILAASLIISVTAGPDAVATWFLPVGLTLALVSIVLHWMAFRLRSRWREEHAEEVLSVAFRGSR